MHLKFEEAQAQDLDEIMAIENAGFSPQEVATRKAMKDRIQDYPDTFIVAKDGQKVVGYIVGPAYDKRYLDDSLYESSHPNRKDDPYQTVLSLAVSPDYRGQGIGSQLLKQLAIVAKKEGRKLISLTCLQKLIPFYEQNGYVNEGVADSSHAGEVWYNMVLVLK